MEKNLQEKNEKIESMKKQMNQTTIIIEKNESEYHEKIQNSKKEFELKILVNFNHKKIYKILLIKGITRSKN